MNVKSRNKKGIMGFCPECNLPAKYVEENIMMQFRLYCAGCGWWKIEHE